MSDTLTIGSGIDRIRLKFEFKADNFVKSIRQPTFIVWHWLSLWGRK